MNFISTILGTLIDLLLPVRCAGCGTPGATLCIRCAGVFDGPFGVQRSPLGHQDLFADLTRPNAESPPDEPPNGGPATDDRTTGRHNETVQRTASDGREVAREPIAADPPIHALATYRDTARTIILSFKERGRRDLAQPLGRMVAAVLPTLDGIQPLTDDTWWLVPVPSKASAARRRGGSHMLALARATATALAERGHSAAVAPALALLNGVRDSTGLNAPARRVNLAGRVKFRPAAAPPRGTRVVLLDDIVTTGTTAAACTEVLTAAGLDVRAVVSLTAT